MLVDANGQALAYVYFGEEPGAVRQPRCSPGTRPGASPPTSSSCWELVQRLDFGFEQHFADQVLGSDRLSYLCYELRRSRPSANIVEDPLTADELFYGYP